MGATVGMGRSGANLNSVVPDAQLDFSRSARLGAFSALAYPSTRCRSSEARDVGSEKSHAWPTPSVIGVGAFGA